MKRMRARAWGDGLGKSVELSGTSAGAATALYPSIAWGGSQGHAWRTPSGVNATCSQTMVVAAIAVEESLMIAGNRGAVHYFDGCARGDRVGFSGEMGEAD